jgi:succinate dehydrogenase/fumarate reductase flavoprotein subunit
MGSTAMPTPSVDGVRDLMWRSVGLFRDRDGLSDAVATLDAAAAVEQPPTPDGRRLRRLVTVARLIARAALRREESRGAHYRSDCPDRDDRRWRVHVIDERNPVK